MTLEADRYEAFCERLQAAVAQAEESCFVPAQPYDAKVSLMDCTDALLDEINRMAPFGCGNPAPLFLARGLRPEERRAVGAEGAHLKLTLRQGGRMLSGIAFSQGALAATLPDEVDAVFSLGRNTFRGVTSLQLDVRALKPVREARAQALEAPDGPEERSALVTALADAFSMQAGKPLSDTESIQETGWSALEAALREGRRGHLLAARTHASARRALALADMDVCAHAPDDPRGFATLLTAPALPLMAGHWRHVWLLDGEAFAGEAALWRDRLPDAQVHILPRSDALMALARAVDAGDEAYRTLYRALRSGIYRTLGQLARAAGMEDAQARAGLHAFCQLGLIDYTPSPFRYMIRPAAKCSLGDSPMLAALRAVAGGA